MASMQSNRINLKNIILSLNPAFFAKFPNFINILILRFLERLLYLRKINRFLLAHGDKKGVAFINEIFDALDFSYSVSSKDKERIPSEGRLIIVANHPCGAMEALAILKAVQEVRKDVKIVANDMLMHIENLRELFLPYNILSVRKVKVDTGNIFTSLQHELKIKKYQKENIDAIAKSLRNEEAVIIFPAAEVSRFGWKGIRDGEWHNGAVYFSRKYNVPILPVYVDAKNSFWFYFTSFINKKLSMLLLPREIFTKRSTTMPIKIGDAIPAKAFNSNLLKSKAEIKLLKKHVYMIGQNKKGIFNTEKNIIHPIDRKAIKSELKNAVLLGTTCDNKHIMLADYEGSPALMQEIARLRELTFRKIGAGTGSKMDSDVYDKYYKHLVLWDDKELEIVGSYRIGICRDILDKHGKEGLYTTSLFDYSLAMDALLPHSIELGRSFVQQKYWNSYALEYLWQGIGAFLTHNPQIKYMFGGVSIASNYNDDARNLIVAYYQKWFGDELMFGQAKHKYMVADKDSLELGQIFSGDSYQEDYKQLKNRLKIWGLSVPTLYKQYSELCMPGGMRFIDFAQDKNFGNTVVGLALVYIDLISDAKKERYMNKPKVLQQVYN